MSFNAGKPKLSGAERRKCEKQKQIAEGALLKKIPKVSTYFCAPTQPESACLALLYLPNLQRRKAC